jgi:hypothetical protein
MFLSLFDSRRERLISQRFAARFVSQLFAALRVPVAPGSAAFARSYISVSVTRVPSSLRSGMASGGGCPA